MFDEEQPKNSNVPGNLPVEPTDMFAGVEHDASAQQVKNPDALTSGLLKKKDPGITVPSGEGIIQPTVGVETKGSPLKMFGIILVILFVLSIIGGGAWWFYERSQSNVLVEKPAGETPVVNVVKEAVSEEPFVPAVQSVVTSTIVENKTDTDGDGLTDARELQLGTDINKTDSDSDLLSDYDEVEVWKTNPLNSDTDGDKYSDGAEIKNGYSPTGPGKLFSNPTTLPAVATSSAPSVSDSATF